MSFKTPAPSATCKTSNMYIPAVSVEQVLHTKIPRSTTPLNRTDYLITCQIQGTHGIPDDTCAFRQELANLRFGAGSQRNRRLPVGHYSEDCTTGYDVEALGFSIRNVLGRS
jgi:hypothetical protein